MTTLMLDDFDTGNVPKEDALLAVAVYTKLEQHYPGHNWRVSADREQGVVDIWLQYLDKLRKNARWGYTLFVSRLDSDPEMRCVVRAGGELLERYGLPREAYRVDYETRLRALEHGLDVSR